MANIAVTGLKRGSILLILTLEVNKNNTTAVKPPQTLNAKDPALGSSLLTATTRFSKLKNVKQRSDNKEYPNQPIFKH